MHKMYEYETSPMPKTKKNILHLNYPCALWHLCILNVHAAGGLANYKMVNFWNCHFGYILFTVEKRFSFLTTSTWHVNYIFLNVDFSFILLLSKDDINVNDSVACSDSISCPQKMAPMNYKPQICTWWSHGQSNLLSTW